MSAITFDSLDDEELRLRRLDALGPVAPSLPLQPIIKAAGISSISTIEKAAEKEAPPQSSAPVLEPPKTHWFYGVMPIHQELERVTDKYSRLSEAQMKLDIAEIDRLEIDRREKLKKQLEEAKSEKNWGVLSSMIHYFSSGASIAVGAACVATGVGAAAGALLIASGVLGMGTRILHDTGAFQAMAAWFSKSVEMQKSIASKIEMGMFFLSCGMGLGGGIWAWKAGAYAAAALSTRAAIVKKLGEGIGLAASVGGSAARFGIAVGEKKTAHLKSDIEEIDLRTNQAYQKIYQDSKDLQNMVDTTRVIGEGIKQAAAESVVHQD